MCVLPVSFTLRCHVLPEVEEHELGPAGADRPTAENVEKAKNPMHDVLFFASGASALIACWLAAKKKSTMGHGVVIAGAAFIAVMMITG
jgi:hypothetical protein